MPAVRECCPISNPWLLGYLDSGSESRSEFKGPPMSSQRTYGSAVLSVVQGLQAPACPGLGHIGCGQPCERKLHFLIAFYSSSSPLPYPRSFARKGSQSPCATSQLHKGFHCLWSYLQTLQSGDSGEDVCSALATFLASVFSFVSNLPLRIKAENK